MSEPPATDDPVGELLEAASVRVRPDRPDHFDAVAPDWFGPRVFGGMVVAQIVEAAQATVEPGLVPHSLHVAFLRPIAPGPVRVTGDRLRDGRTFTTREMTVHQDDRRAAVGAVSFHRDEPGPAYELAMPDAPAPEGLPEAEDTPPPFEVRWVGPTPRRDDGTYRSTRRCWVRTISPLPDDPRARTVVAAFLSDMTGTSFRPHNLGEWGTHTDASIDHAVWFHRPCRPDRWLYMDFHTLVSTGGRSTVRGEVYDADGRLCLSMAQELLVRPLGDP